MMIRKYARAVRLLPVAVWRYLRREKGVPAPLLVLPVLLIPALLLCVLAHSGPASSRAVEAPPPDASPAAAPTPSPPVRQVTLTFAGDCTLGMDPTLGYSGSFNEMYDREGPDYFLRGVRDLFREDDLTVVNLEGALTDSQDRADKTWTFRGEPSYTQVLTLGGVEAADLANNHSHDYGDAGFSDTARALDQAGIAHFGYDEVTVLEAGGVKVGFSGQFTVYEDPQHLADLERNIRSLQDQGAEVIVACFHWGLENDGTPEADQIALAHAAIDAGASLVIGHHPHVLQGVEIYKGRYIVYSLGNFCFGGNYDPPDYDCILRPGGSGASWRCSGGHSLRHLLRGKLQQLPAHPGGRIGKGKDPGEAAGAERGAGRQKPV